MLCVVAAADMSLPPRGTHCKLITMVPGNDVPTRHRADLAETRAALAAAQAPVEPVDDGDGSDIVGDAGDRTMEGTSGATANLPDQSGAAVSEDEEAASAAAAAAAAAAAHAEKLRRELDDVKRANGSLERSLDTALKKSAEDRRFLETELRFGSLPVFSFF